MWRSFWKTMDPSRTGIPFGANDPRLIHIGRASTNTEAEYVDNDQLPDEYVESPQKRDLLRLARETFNLVTIIDSKFVPLEEAKTPSLSLSQQQIEGSCPQILLSSMLEFGYEHPSAKPIDSKAPSESKSKLETVAIVDSPIETPAKSPRSKKKYTRSKDIPQRNRLDDVLEDLSSIIENFKDNKNSSTGSV
ncbi:hypothetical protein RFI_15934 [Reticulomyxa filosa]|uniref:Uncharacterized protein n=1 Tax=Reticulomyxa filosa TaxID=46433 RepID=X6N681_RETFI|nr:hypothetical protein RFI_15934 [Reticulomyxa filosa]|eukprot:ETO21269.1 hypothetical protein RFI_15934 [Reticulomyxa filosa]